MDQAESGHQIPDYYEAVMKGAKHSSKGYPLLPCSDPRDSDRFQKLAAKEPIGTLREIQFLDASGAITTNTRDAVAALGFGEGPFASVIFRGSFAQPKPPPLGSRTPSLYQPVPQPPLMSNEQAERLARDPKTHLDYDGNFRAG